jgi:hypothetical protein
VSAGSNASIGVGPQCTLAADAELRVAWINQLSQFTGIRAAEIFFEPLQFHLEIADLLEQLSFFGLALLLDLALLASRKQLTGIIEQLLLPLAYLDGVDRVISSDLLDRLAATDRLHGDSSLEFRTVSAALAHEWEPHFRGGTPPQRLTMGPVKKNQTSTLLASASSGLD